jgi:large subunit ribosomal protein L9
MKVILKEDVKGLGRKEDMVNVNDGYARNFLLPRGAAVEASKANMNIMKTRKDAERTKKDRDRSNAETQAGKLKGQGIVIKSKAGENGRLFGSITSKDIVEALKSQHRLEVDKKKVALEEPFKTLGEHMVDIKLHTGIAVSLKVTVEAE